jgi:glycosyltransferase involved in cell wall biosynthesis
LNDSVTHSGASDTSKNQGGLRIKNVFKHSGSLTPLVSILTVVYNGETYVEQTIKSVLDQTYKNIEYIIIDGGSVDNTIDIIKKYDEQIDYWISEPDKGISDAFNKGIRLAKGDIVGIINADDWYEKDTVETIVHEFQRDPNIDIVCGLLKFWAHNTQDYIFTSDPSLLDKTMTINHPTVFVKRQLYHMYGLFNLEYKYAMDYDLMLRFKIKGAHFKSIEKILANMRLEGISDTAYIKSFNEVRKIKMQYFNKYKVELFFYKQIISRTISKLFTKFGLDFIVEFYRKNFSAVKKMK